MTPRKILLLLSMLLLLPLAAAAGELLAVIPLNEGGQLRVDLIANQPIERYEVFSLTQPDRLVIDLYGMSFKAGNSVFEPLDRSVVSRIRIGRQQTATRVVLDLNRVMPYEARADYDRLEIIFKQPPTPVATAYVSEKAPEYGSEIVIQPSDSRPRMAEPRQTLAVFSRPRVFFNLRAGALSVPAAGDFYLTGDDSYTGKTWDIDGDFAPLVGFGVGIQPTEHFAAEFTYETMLSDKLDLTIMGFEPRWVLGKWKGITPYLKVGGLYANLDWDDIPCGEFDFAKGWSAGGGFTAGIFNWPIQIGGDLAYRDLRFKYEYDSNYEWVRCPLNDELDFSGFEVSAFIALRF